MTSATTDLRREHEHLRARLQAMLVFADGLDRLTHGAIASGIDHTLSFFELELGPHAAAEEAVLYPAVAELIGDPGMPGVMVFDHREIQRLVGQLREMRQNLQIGPDHAPLLRQKLHGIYTLVRAHMDEEEDVYLAAVDEHLTIERGYDLFRRMEEASHTAVTSARHRHSVSPYP